MMPNFDFSTWMLLSALGGVVVGWLANSKYNPKPKLQSLKDADWDRLYKSYQEHLERAREEKKDVLLKGIGDTLK